MKKTIRRKLKPASGGGGEGVAYPLSAHSSIQKDQHQGPRFKPYSQKYSAMRRKGSKPKVRTGQYIVPVIRLFSDLKYQVFQVRSIKSMKVDSVQSI